MSTPKPNITPNTIINKKIDTSSKFGKGWGIIAYCGAMFFLLIGFSIDGMNIVAPAFAKKYGYNYADVLGMATYAGYFAVVAYFFFGWLCKKTGARVTASICMLGAGLSYMFYGRATTMTEYGIGLTLVVCFINGGSYIGGNALISQWFPKKKGLVNGYTTMGHNLGSAFYVPLISFLIGAYGLANGTTIASFIGIALGIIGFIYLRNTPFERGINPDNVSDEIYKAEYFHNEANTENEWTVIKLLRTKETWLVAIVIGLNQLVTTGVMSQLVVRNVGLGFQQNTAIFIMTILACIGVVGSYSFGWLDTRFGTKKAIIFFLAWYMCALALNVIETKVSIYISIFMIGMAIGGSANFIGSLPVSVFGRHGFSSAFSVIFPMMSVLLFSNYIINATAIRITGSLRGAYATYIVILFINLIVIRFVNETKYNKDHMVEEKVVENN